MSTAAPITEPTIPRLASVELTQTARTQERHPFYVPSLDGIRAVAILLVFLAHAGLNKLIPGGFGVTVFFFLSGYLITTLLRREYARNHKISFKQFYLRRMLRIWPAFYAVLFAGVVLTLLHVFEGGLVLAPLFAQLLHFANYYSILFGPDNMIAGTNVFWSLAVEEHFYLLFPFIYSCLLKSELTPRRQVAALLAICVLVFAWRVYLVLGMHVSVDRTYYGSDTRFDGLLFGCCLAISGNPMLDGKPRNEALFKWVMFPSALLALLASFLFRSDVFRETIRYTVQGIALMPVFVGAIAFPDWLPFRWLNLGWMRFMGSISYGFYLVHFMVIAVVATYCAAAPLWLQGILSFGLAVLTAYLMNKVLEAPFARIRRKLSAG